MVSSKTRTPSLKILLPLVLAAGVISLLWLPLRTTGAVIDEAPQLQTISCWATPDDGTTVFSSEDAGAVQQAVAAAAPGATAKVAGHCPGVQSQAGTTQTVYINQSLTLQGGYTYTNWIVSDPAAFPTVLDAQNNGRVIFIAGGDVTLDGLNLTGGRTGGMGGGVFNQGELTIIQSGIIQNRADSGGGGVMSLGPVSIRASTLAYNVGDGLRVTLGSSPNLVTILNSTLSDNTGSGFFNAGGDAYVVHSTVVHNGGTGIWSEDSGPNTGTVAPNNSLMAYNAGGDCGGSGILSQGYNLDSDMSCLAIALPSDLPASTVFLGVLGDYGGPTLTRPLLPVVGNDTAVNNGDCASGAVMADQRGVARPQWGVCDRGAYEYDGAFVAAGDDHFVADAGSEISFNVLLNDFTVVPAPLAVTAVISPQAGTLNDDGGGNFTYRPFPGTSGFDTFTYQVTAGGFTSTGEVVITVNPANSPTPVLGLDWVSTLTPNAVAPADIDNDGDLDLAVADNTVRIFVNQDGALPPDPEWEANGSSGASGLAWGDVDLDGDLDLAVIRDGGEDQLYLNHQGVLDTTPAWTSGTSGNSRDLAWADVDGDGWLDLVTGGDAGYRVHTNLSGTLAAGSNLSTTAVASLALEDMDGDGLLDLALSLEATDSHTVSVHLNTGAGFTTYPVWQNVSGLFESSANDLQWGDVDNDGDPDLVLARLFGGISLFLNEDGLLQDTPAWNWAGFGLGPHFITWGDVNGDSLLDLVADTSVIACGGVCNSVTYLFLNQNGVLNGSAAWQSNGSGFIANGPSVIADMNGDGVMDVLTGQDFIKRFTNSQTPQFNNWDSSLEHFMLLSGPAAQAWGDVDGDGDLDLAAAGDESALYLNHHGRFKQIFVDPFTVAEAAWVGPTQAKSVAWGDADGDGLLDLAIGRNGQNHLYLNTGSILAATAAWTSGEAVDTRQIAWGDVDGDGDLDLAAADDDGVRLYTNLSGTLSLSATWAVTSAVSAREVAWGDVDNDGNLDLAVAGDGATRLYLNQSGWLQSTPVWQVEGASSLDWGDMDNDGDLDLALGRSGPNAVYRNVAGALEDEPYWFSLDTDPLNVRIEWVDINNDSYPELWAVNRWGVEPPATSRLYANAYGVLEQSSNVNHLGDQIDGSAADMDGDGDKDIVYYGGSPICFGCDGIHIYYSQADKPALPPVMGSGLGPAISLYSDGAITFNGQTTHALATADNYALAHIRTHTVIPITYTTAVAARPALQIRGFYSLNGGGDWLPAVATTDTLTMHISMDGLPRVYKWDTAASGLFGQSDQVIFRLELVPGGHGVNGTPPVQQRPFVAAQTNPFRVRGTQVRVLSGTQPVANALVYRLPAGQTSGAGLMAADDGRPLRTNVSGYLQGRGQINVGDTLYALLPITHTDSYTLYHSNGTPVETGMNGHVVTESGTQSLIVSPENTLTLLNPTVSLEWDSRQDPAYLLELADDLQRASEILFDVTNGQVALGQIRVYQAKENWTSAHVTVYAANNVRPSATMGGVVSQPVSDLITGTGVITDAYLPGQVRMGPTWSRFGDPNANLGEDWARALAHELGHFFLFLPDNYLGVVDGRLVPTDCFGSFMTNAYTEEYSEFLTEADWAGPCLQTIAEQVTGRPDWETIGRFYPWLRSDTLMAGPNLLPLQVAAVTFVEPEEAPTALPAPFFSLRGTDNLPLFVANGEGAGYLIKNADTPSPADDYVVALGAPVGDQMEARGAEPGDRICVYDYSRDPIGLGCDIVGASEGEITVAGLPGWQPQMQIAVRAVTLTAPALLTRTLGLSLTVTQAVSGDLYAQVMPATGFSTTFPITATAVELLPQDPTQPITFTRFLTLPYPTLELFVRVWVEGSNPAQEMMTQFFLGSGWGGNRAAWGGNRAAWGGNRAAWGAPVASGNGQVIVFNLEDIFGDTGTASLQALSTPPPLRSWMKLVGQAYRFEASTAVTRTISFNYLQTDVPGGNLYEGFLQVYYSPDAGQSWLPLATELDTQDNLAAATMPAAAEGSGLYALISAIPLPALDEGWNLFAYPLPDTRPVTETFASIAGSYTSVYHQAAGNWQLYDATVTGVQPELAAYVNDLEEIAFGEAYWIYATEPVTVYVGLPGTGALHSAGADLPPATYYGWITATTAFTPAAGMAVTAAIDGQVCGQGTVTAAVAPGRWAYKLQVAANAGDGCGSVGDIIVFAVGGQQMPQTAVWDNRQAWYHPLQAGIARVYLPVMLKP